MISYAFAEKMGIPLSSPAKEVSMMVPGSTKTHVVITDQCSLQLSCNRKTIERTAYVTHMSDNVLLSRSELNAWQICYTNVPLKFDSDSEEEVASVTPPSGPSLDERSLSEGALDKATLVQEYSKEFTAELARVLSEIMGKNAKIGMDEFCNHPKAVVEIDTGDSKGSIHQQYPLSPEALDFLDTWLADMMAIGKIEQGNAFTQWLSPLNLAMDKWATQGASGPSSD
jgi:hypothetical protein